MRRLLLAAAFVAGALFLGAPAAQAQINANASNMTVVGFEGGGSFTKESSGWAERGANGQIAFKYEEARRDANAVFLYDSARGVHIALDMHRKEVMYAPNGQEFKTLYKIVSASTGSPAPSGGVAANTQNTTNVTYQGGAFSKEGNGWVERNGNGEYRYEEARREPLAVYLYDAARGVHIALDLHRKEVMYAPNGQDLKPLYKITSSN